MAFELVCGADFWCNRHCRTSPVDLECFWGQVWPKINRKPARKSEFLLATDNLIQNCEWVFIPLISLKQTAPAAAAPRPGGPGGPGPGKHRKAIWPGKHRPSGRPSAGRRADFGALPARRPAKIRPGRPIDGPEALLRNIEYLDPITRRPNFDRNSLGMALCVKEIEGQRSGQGSGLVWSGAWSGLVWPGLDWSGLVKGLVWSGVWGLVWSGLAWSGLVWPGMVWSGLWPQTLDRIPKPKQWTLSANPKRNH